MSVSNTPVSFLPFLRPPTLSPFSLSLSPLKIHTYITLSLSFSLFSFQFSVLFFNPFISSLKFQHQNKTLFSFLLFASSKWTFCWVPLSPSTSPPLRRRSTPPNPPKPSTLASPPTPPKVHPRSEPRTTPTMRTTPFLRKETKTTQNTTTTTTNKKNKCTRR